ncbi:MAG TPA: hypothetical protein VN446_03755 [Candidatus Acidoferrum sp.]|nr:hypothetical protein [Candidatus Acidoferrum sp.]
MVDIALPASVFDGEDMSSFGFEAYKSENGFKAATLRTWAQVM